MSSETISQEQMELVVVTPEARAEFKRLLDEQSDKGLAIRLGVKGGGCSGLSYLIDFDTVRDGDHVVEEDGVRLLLDRKSAVYLRGAVVAFEEGLKGRGFVFRNPNAASTCGCGESFSV